MFGINSVQIIRIFKVSLYRRRPRDINRFQRSTRAIYGGPCHEWDSFASSSFDSGPTRANSRPPIRTESRAESGSIIKKSPVNSRVLRPRHCLARAFTQACKPFSVEVITFNRKSLPLYRTANSKILARF